MSQIFYVAVKNLAKASTLLLFLRIFADQRFRLFTKIFLAWMACSNFAFTMATSLQCIPVQAVWKLSIDGKCVNTSAVNFAVAAFSIFEDVVIILLPVPELKSLPLSLRQRLGVMFMLAFGSL